MIQDIKHLLSDGCFILFLEDMFMKAWVLHGVGDIRFENRDKPLPVGGEVLIKVEAAGVCGSDIPRIYDTGAHRMPLIPGHEFSGKVEAVGEAADAGWIGKRVGVFPMIPCGKCIPCLKGQPETCQDYDYVGSRRDGAFAEYLRVPERNLIELPKGVSYEAAAMLEPMAVAVHAMRRGENLIRRSRENKHSAVICGMGTIGMLLAMFLLDRGTYNICMVGNKDSQIVRAAKLGISEEEICDSRKTDVVGWIKDRTGDDGPDLFFECIGNNDSLSYGIDTVSSGSCVVLVGNPQSDMRLKRDTYWKILRKQAYLTGSWNSSFHQSKKREHCEDDWNYVLKRLDQGRVDPEQLITHKLSIDDLEKGLFIMKDKTEDYCKVMIRF